MKLDLPIHPRNLTDDLRVLQREMSNSNIPEMRISANLFAVYLYNLETILMDSRIEEPEHD